ncbi:hypothetical protein [Sphingomonas beigongshangi]|uniref:hypothetical protein n=1 Tax=Sphingomonas beigongshangi TaxID=2782540 RepID=UPI00193B5DD5|nr:hypothetical protein [Sphingomonas beigongshangi]
MIPAWVLRYAAPPLVVAAIVAWLWLGWSHADNRADKLQTQLTTQTARAEAAERKVKAMAQADAERAMDDSKIDQMKDDLTHAISTAPKGTAPGPATLALGCARMRAAGRTASPTYSAKCR